MSLRTAKQLRPQQRQTANSIKELKRCALIANMGSGKTATVLTALAEIKPKRTLIIAPLKVANTVWDQEALGWEHLKHLTFSICCGPAKYRKQALAKPADIYVINAEQIPWLLEQNEQFDAIVVDESTKFKNMGSKKWKALIKFKSEYMVLMTGTPKPNGYMDLWAQYALVDRGKRLGKNITMFRNKWFFKGGFRGRQYFVRDGAGPEILDAISDITLHMEGVNLQVDKQVISVNPSVDAERLYNTLRQDLVAILNDDLIIVKSATGLSNKLLQICNGAVYDEERNYTVVHDSKIEALRTMQRPLLVAYNFISDKKRILEAFPEAIAMSRDGREVADWNSGKIQMLLIHPASAGHGLNLQFGGSMLVWFGLPWNLEHYQQTNARLARPGQKDVTQIVHLVIEGWIDDLVVAARLEQKALTQKEMFDYLRARL